MSEEKAPSNESFRDSISTVTNQGKRHFIYPKKTNGSYSNKRIWLSYLLLVFLFSAPFVKINGNQFLLFNVLERKFSLFGFIFWPQDFYLFVLIMIILVIGVTLFTIAFGRIFCGWVCPQTIFMEMVFRRIEYLIEGDRGAQIRLNKQPWNLDKIGKKSLKWSVFFIISFLISNVFMAYVISSDELLLMISQGPKQHFSTLISLLIFTMVFYFVFAWFREQVCVIACPYGRLQGVLLDNQSMVVAYDFKRGEKAKGRAKFDKRKNREALGQGDCIDCNECVLVCPTGIDIRNGTQLECVNCTACMDACDNIMDKVGLEKELIRYASIDGIEKSKPFKITLRMKAYLGVLIGLIGVFLVLLTLRNSIDVKVLKLPGQLYQKRDNNILNIYTYSVINKTNQDISDLKFKLLNYASGKITVLGDSVLFVKKNELIKGRLLIEIPADNLQKEKTKITLGLYQKEQEVESVSTNFLGPLKLK